MSARASLAHWCPESETWELSSARYAKLFEVAFKAGYERGAGLKP